MPRAVAAFVRKIKTVMYSSPKSVNAIDHFKYAGRRSIDDISEALNCQPVLRWDIDRSQGAVLA